MRKIGTLALFFRVLGIFLSFVRLGTGTTYARAMLIFKSQLVMLIHFTNLAAQNTVKQRMATRKKP